ncbi:RraA family protein [Rhodococcoides kyotonense]|uniref:Putative 4-hydroxy-4-methyl-2-oxoglutarate aldolase n=1 Tax=Rhodococcoides kyotonense TaxID=398843 RepID=A0A239LXX9_9NOCA|nr:RraA family protein [Rhodococcus kyotonensis]SNT35517.1 Regulator of RNase E activity RraA [Rhodococcus kyotonensis]
MSETLVDWRRTTGTVPQSKIATDRVPRHDTDLASRLLEVPDTSSAVADALDELGIGSVLGSTGLAPLSDDSRVCGQAVTLRYIPLDADVTANRNAGRGKVFGDRDLYGIGSPGDVAVMDCSGLQSGAVMGALSAKWAVKAGIAGCIVDGSVRDSGSILASDLPVWSAGRMPAAARYRYEIAEVNGPVVLRGNTVRPGDYIVADIDGVCIVPFEDMPRVVEYCEEAQRAEATFVERIDAASSLEKLIEGMTPGTAPA